MHNYRDYKPHREDKQPDFKMSFLNVTKTTFPNTIIQGCLFHLNQSIWRYAENHRLRTSFADRMNFPEVR